jgi:hypothetical protein
MVSERKEAPHVQSDTGRQVVSKTKLQKQRIGQSELSLAYKTVTKVRSRVVALSKEETVDASNTRQVSGFKGRKHLRPSNQSEA